MAISIFLTFVLVKLLKSLNNIADIKNVLLQIKIVESINILSFLIQILIKL